MSARALARERAAPLRDVRLVLVAEVLEARLDRADGSVGERTERLEQDVPTELVQERQVLLATVALLDPPEHATHPPRALAARRALATRLVRIELHQASGRLDDAVGLVHHDDRAGPE